MKFFTGTVADTVNGAESDQDEEGEETKRTSKETTPEERESRERALNWEVLRGLISVPENVKCQPSSWWLREEYDVDLLLAVYRHGMVLKSILTGIIFVLASLCTYVCV